jgi:hypothetical protein
MSIVIAGTKAIIEIPASIRELQELQDYSPSSLKLATETGEVSFLILVRPGHEGNLSAAGAIFGRDAAGAGKAVIEIDIPENAGDVKQWFLTHYAVPYAKLLRVLPQLTAARAELTDVRAAVGDTIQILSVPSA